MGLKIFVKVENDLEPPVDWQHERASAVALGIHSFIGSLIVFMKLNIAIIVQYISDPHPLSSDYLIYQQLLTSSSPSPPPPIHNHHYAKASLRPARPSRLLTSRLRRSARKWEVMIFRDAQTDKHFIIIYISSLQSFT